MQSSDIRLSQTSKRPTGAQIAQAAVDAAFKVMNVPRIIEPLEVESASQCIVSYIDNAKLT